MKKYILALLILLFAISAEAANYPLEIIQPRAGLTSGVLATNRFYKAYPGIEYNVKIAVIGGAYPFTYSLTQAPPFMTINASNGVISWNATTTGQPFTITARVVDQEGTVATVTWTLTVTTQRFIFVDSVNGTASTCNGGSNASGGIGQPFRSVADWYCGQDYNGRQYTGYFVYYRTGTYTGNGYHQSGYGNTLWMSDDGSFSPNKPMVHMAYPGATAGTVEIVTWTMEQPTPTSGGGIYFHNTEANMYFDGIRFTNIVNTGERGIATDGNGGHVTIRRCLFDGRIGTQGTSNNNASAIFLEKFNVGTPEAYHYYSITENNFTNFASASGMIIYFRDRVLIEGNTFTNTANTLGNDWGANIFIKESDSNVFIRNNRITNNAWKGIGIPYYKDFSNTQITMKDLEIDHNVIHQTSGFGLINSQDQFYEGGPIYFHHNTVYTTGSAGGGVGFYYNQPGSNGPFYVYNNVIVNNNTAPPYVQGIDCRFPGSLPCTSYSNVVISNTHGCPANCNLSGSPSAGLIDAAGALSTVPGSCGSVPCSFYKGIYGYELTTTVTPSLVPNPPTNFVLTP